MDIVLWIFVGLVMVLFTVLFVLDEVEYNKRINELNKEGKAIYIFRI